MPAPFVVLAQHLPMAVLYDPATLDLSDAAVADRLRKQAKTRAVKVPPSRPSLSCTALLPCAPPPQAGLSPCDVRVLEGVCVHPTWNL